MLRIFQRIAIAPLTLKGALLAAAFPFRGPMGERRAGSFVINDTSYHPSGGLKPSDGFLGNY